MAVIDAVFWLLLLSPFLLLGTVAAPGGDGAPKVLMIPVEQIMPDPNQPRKQFDKDKLDQLAADIRARSMMNAIIVRWDAGRGRWVIVAGERRYRAACQLGLKEVPCRDIGRELTEAEALEDGLAENLIRDDLKPMEISRSIERLMKLRGWSAKEAAERLHVSNAYVSRALARLLLPPDLQEKVDTGEIPSSVADCLAGIGEEAVLREIAERVVAGVMTRQEVLQEIHARYGKKSVTPKKSRLVAQLNGMSATISNGSELTAQAVADFAQWLYRQAKNAVAKGIPYEQFARSVKGE